MDQQQHSSGNDDYVGKSLEVTIKIDLVIALLVWCFMILKPFFMIALWSIILAVTIYPLFRWIRGKLGNRRIIASILVTFFLLILILLPVVLLGESLAQAVEYVKEALTSGKALIPPPPESVREWPLIGSPLFGLWQNASENLADFAMKYKSQLMTSLTWFISALTSAGLGFLIIIASILISGVLLVYAEKGGEAARRISIRLMGDRGPGTIEKAELTVRNVARGILGIAFIQAFLVGIGLLVAGIPGAGLWALICFILAIVQIGILPVVIGVLIYAFVKLSMLTAILLTVYCVIPMVIDNILKPILMGRKAQAPMLVVFLGAIGGFISFGIIGLFTGAVVLSLGYDLFTLWLNPNKP